MTINPARHMRLTPWVGSLSPGRFADIVLLSMSPSLTIAKVWADGAQVSEGTRYTGPVPEIDWPEWATKTVNIERTIEPHDFAHCRRARPRHHAGRGDPAVPLAPGFLHHGAAGARRRGAARREREPSPNSPSSTASPARATSQRCSGAAAGRARRTPRSPARWRTTSTTSGASARPTPRWPRRSTRCVEHPGRLGAGARGRARRHRALRDRRPDELPLRPRRSMPRCRRSTPKAEKVDWMYEPTFRPRW